MKKLRNWYNCELKNKHKVNVSDNKCSICGRDFESDKKESK